MSDGLIEALKWAGVPTKAARDAWEKAPVSVVEDVLDVSLRAAIAADRDAVLRVLLRAHLVAIEEAEPSGGERSHRIAVAADDFACSLGNVDAFVSALLAPEVPHG